LNCTGGPSQGFGLPVLFAKGTADTAVAHLILAAVRGF